MNTDLRNSESGRLLYNQLRFKLIFPGDEVAGVRKTFAPVNKDSWTWETAMSAPDTPMVAQHRRHEIGMRFMIGQVH